MPLERGVCWEESHREEPTLQLPGHAGASQPGPELWGVASVTRALKSPWNNSSELWERAREPGENWGKKTVGDLADTPSRMQVHWDPCTTSLQTITPKAPSKIQTGPNSCLAHLDPGDLGIKVSGHGWRGSTAKGRQGGASIPWEWVLEAASLPGGIILSRHFLVQSKTHSINHSAPPHSIFLQHPTSLQPFPPFPGNNEIRTILIPLLASPWDPGAVPGQVAQPFPPGSACPGLQQPAAASLERNPPGLNLLHPRESSRLSRFYPVFNYCHLLFPAPGAARAVWWLSGSG